MKKQFASILMVGVMVFTGLTAFGNTSENSNISAETNNYAVSFAGLNMEYCTVDLDNPRSNLNVRTWEGRVIGKLKHGTSVWVNEYSGEWARVSVKRGRKWVSIGWVDSNYLLC